MVRVNSRVRNTAIVVVALVVVGLVSLTLWGQTPPIAPTSLFVHSSDAQAGDASPASAVDLTPVFSAVFNDTDAGALGKKIKIQVSSDQTFAVVSHWNSGQIAIADVANGARCQNVDYNGQPLSGLTTYFWRCKFWDEADAAGDWSSVATFTTGPAPLAPATLLVDSVDAAMQSNGNPVVEIDQSPVFTAIFTHQNAAATANKAKIQVSTDSTFATVTHWNSGQLTMANTAHNARTPNIAYNGQYLQGDTVYYWRIRLYDELGNASPWSTEAASFRTILVPSAPTSLQVGSTEAQTGTSGNPVTNIDLTPVFSAVVNHPNAAMAATQVRIQVSTDSTFATVSHWNSGKINITPTLPSTRCPNVAYNGQPLAGQTTYYWRVRFFATDGGVSEWSTQPASFTTQAAPLSPTTLFVGSSEAQSSAQGDPVNLIDLNPAFSAIYQHQNTGVDGSKVKVQVSTDATFADVTHWNSGQIAIANVANGTRCADVIYNGQLLRGNTRYFWRMRFYDANDNPGPWSTEAASFITILAPTEPTELFVGSDNAQSGASGNPVTGIDLTPVFSARFHHQDVAGIGKKIKVQVTTDPTFTNITHWNSAQITVANLADGARSQDIAYAGSPLSNSTTYYWRVRFFDAYPSTGPWSTEGASFTTIGAGTPEPAALSIPNLLQGGVYNNVTVTKSGGIAFSAGNSFELVSGGVSVSSVQVQDANTLLVTFNVDELSIAGNRTFQVRSGGDVIASGPAYVFYPSQRVPARRNGIAQEPLLNPALVSAGVVASTGEFLFEAQDLLLPGRMLPLGFGRNYRSFLEFDGTMGQSWASVVDDQLRYDATGDSIIYFSADGRLHTLTLAASGTAGSGPYVETGSYVEWSRADQGDSDPLNDVYTALGAHGDKATYVASNLDTEGRQVYRLASMADRFNNTVLLVRDAIGRVTEIRGDLYLATEPTRHRLLLDYGPDGRLKSIEDFADYTGEPADIVGSFTGPRTWNFVYDAKGRLAQVLLPKTKDWFDDEISSLSARARMLYEYSNAANPNLITDVHSPRQVALLQFNGSGLSWLRNVADAQGRVVGQDIGRSSATDTTHRYHIVYGSGTCDVVDPLGRRARITLTSSGRVQASAAFTGFFDNTLSQTITKLRTTDPDTFIYSYEYNSQGEVSRMTMPRGNITAWFYDEANASQRAKGNLLRAVALPGTADTQGLPPLPGAQANGLLTTFTYTTDFNLLATSVDPRAFDLQASYDISLPGQFSRDDSAHFTTTRVYDAQGRMLRVESPIVTAAASPLSPDEGQQQILEFQYNGFGQVTREADSSTYAGGAVGRTTNLVYGTIGYGRGYVVSQIDGQGTGDQSTMQFAYSSVGLLLNTTDSAGAIWTTHINQLDFEVRTFAPALSRLGGHRYRVDTSFDRDGNSVSRTLENPPLDDLGNLSAGGGSRAHTTSFTRNIMGFVVATSESVTASTTRTSIDVYNGVFENVARLTPGGTKDVTEFDERGQVYRVFRGLRSEATTTSEALAHEAFDYDLNGNLTKVIDPRGTPRTRRFDAFDRLVLQSDARTTASTMTITYDQAGNAIAEEIVGAPGDSSVASTPTAVLRRIERQFDNMSRLYRQASRAKKADLSTDLGYDPEITTRTNDRLGWQVRTMSYYPDGRISKEFQDLLSGATPATSTALVSFEYDALGRRKRIIDVAGNEVAWAYDLAGNLASVAERKRSQLSQSLTEVIKRFTYDELGREVETWTDLPTGSEPRTTTVYDAMNVAVVQNVPSRGRANRQTDLLGRITSASITATRRVLSGTSVIQASTTTTYTTTFQYNDDDLLIALTDNSSRVTQRRYDLLRRHLQTVLPDGAVFTVGMTDTVTPITGKPGYIEATTGYDASGNVQAVNDLGQNVVVRTYNLENELTQVSVTPSVPGVLSGEHSAGFVYDGLGRIIQCTSFDPSANSTSRQHSWNSLSKLDGVTQLFDAQDDGSFVNSVDELGRTFKTIRGSTAILYSFDELSRVNVTRYQNSFGTTLYSSGKAYVGSSRLAEGRTLTGTHDLIYERDAAGRATSAMAVPRFGSDPPRDRFSFEYCPNCGALFAVIDNDRKIPGTSRVRGTRYLYDGFGRLYGTVNNATFPSSGTFRSPQYGTDDASSTEVELHDLDDRVSKRVSFLGNKQSLNDADAAVDIPHDASLEPTAIGDVDLARSLPSYTAITDDGVFSYSYDYQGRLISRKRNSDSLVLERRRYDALGLECPRQYEQMQVAEADFSSGELAHVYFSSTDRDWQGGGVRFNSMGGSDFIEMYFPGEIRPRNSFDSFQGAQVSYHDFLLSGNASASVDAMIAFESWLDGYKFEFEIKDSSIDLYEYYPYYDTQQQQWTTTRNFLTSTTISSSALRSLGIRFDIGPTAAMGNTVQIELWLNGVQRLSTFTRVMDNTRAYVPQAIRFYTSANGSKLYRYHGYVGVDPSPPGIQLQGRRKLTDRGVLMLCNVQTPGEGTPAPFLGQIDQELHGMQLEVGQLQLGLNELDFSEITGYADLIHRARGSQLLSASVACKNSLQKSIDWLKRSMSLLRTAMQKYGDATNLMARLNQVSQQYTFLVRPEDVTDVPDGQGGYFANVKGFVTSCSSPVGGWRPVGFWFERHFNSPPNPVTEWFVDCYAALVSDVAGKLVLVHFYVPSDWAPTAECDPVLTGEQQRRLKLSYQSQLMQYRYDEQYRRAELEEVRTSLEPLFRDIKAEYEATLSSYSNLSLHFFFCRRIFEQDSHLARFDTALSEALLTLISIRVGQMGTGRTSGAPKSPAANRTPRPRADMCFVAGTQVLTETGPKDIEDVRVGDWVLSMDEESGEQGYKRVVETFTTRPVELIHLTYREVGVNQVGMQRAESGASKTTEPVVSIVTGTPNHPFWSATRHAWVEMGSLAQGERLVLSDGSTAVVLNVVREQAEAGVDGRPTAFVTYNFEVEDWHTYFVSSSSASAHKAIWVHNRGRICPLEFDKFAKMNQRHPNLVNKMDLDPRDLAEIQRRSGKGNLDWSGIDPKGRTRIDHVKAHEVQNLRKKEHSLFHEDSIQTTEEAWARAQQKGIKGKVDPDTGNLLYDVPMDRVVGQAGGRHNVNAFVPCDRVRIVIEKGTLNKVITAYPIP